MDENIVDPDQLACKSVDLTLHHFHAIQKGSIQLAIGLSVMKILPAHQFHGDF